MSAYIGDGPRSTDLRSTLLPIPRSYRSGVCRHGLIPSLALVLVLALSGCGTGESPPSRVSADSGHDREEPIESSEIPDLIGEDGADAVAAIEDLGLTVALVDAHDDPGFDESRDPSGCEVTDQDPHGGERSLPDEGTVILTVDCAQVDWDNREGPDWEDFSSGYSDGFDDGCEALFDESPTGVLYEDDDEYSVFDCRLENPGDASMASDVP